MKRLQILILIFFVALSVPLGYFVLSTYRGLEQEEAATLNFFANTLFDEMERALEALVKMEEARAIDEYNFYMSPPGGRHAENRSPLSHLPAQDYILGYLQNNPDGSFQTPLIEAGKPVTTDRKGAVTELERANRLFNRKRTADTDKITVPAAPKMAEVEHKQQSGFAEKYLDLTRSKKPRARLGQDEKRFEKVTVAQAENVARQEVGEAVRRPAPPAASLSKSGPARGPAAEDSLTDSGKGHAAKIFRSREEYPVASESAAQGEAATESRDQENFQVEVAPLQSVLINADQMFIFRRIMIDRKIYRQGFILKLRTFLNHLAQNYFIAQPMAEYANLRLQVMDQGREIVRVLGGKSTHNPVFILNRTFPSPFAFLNATLSSDEIPRSTGRNTLMIMMVVLAAIFLIGLFAIYKSVWAIVDLSERRSQFVSSVTHELKTPLTNIRMYIEMLEQGIAKDTEREQEYFQIINSEGSRLSRLINNVLDLAKLEKKQRSLNLTQGTFEEVVSEVQAVMQAKLRQEGFTLKIVQQDIRPFKYDREAMIQVLINLIENSIKFCQSALKKEITIRIYQEPNRVKIAVSDHGPGIPTHALKKIFDDFYRVDNTLARKTRGTGIGLALVKKFVKLIGGNVTAENNRGSGCTITISLPIDD
ncbi:MAG: HAMP domain-containing sensor histidine kinase [Desulfobacterales bacterium]|jgi:signal transduction histidine kinase